MESKFPTIFLIGKEKKDFLTGGRGKRVPRSTPSTTLYVKVFQSGRTFFVVSFPSQWDLRMVLEKWKEELKNWCLSLFKEMLWFFKKSSISFWKDDHLFGELYGDNIQLAVPYLFCSMQRGAMNRIHNVFFCPFA